MVGGGGVVTWGRRETSGTVALVVLVVGWGATLRASMVGGSEEAVKEEEPAGAMVPEES